MTRPAAALKGLDACLSLGYLFLGLNPRLASLAGIEACTKLWHVDLFDVPVRFSFQTQLLLVLTGCEGVQWAPSE